MDFIACQGLKCLLFENSIQCLHSLKSPPNSFVLASLCDMSLPLSFSLSGGSGEGLSEGERTGRIGVAESDVISDVAIRPALTHVVRGRVQRGGLRQEVSPSSYIIRALLTDTSNKNIIIVLLPLVFRFLLLKLRPHTLASTCKVSVVLSTLCVYVCLRVR